MAFLAAIEGADSNEDIAHKQVVKKERPCFDRV
jgi:hypothetical protein